METEAMSIYRGESGDMRVVEKKTKAQQLILFHIQGEEELICGSKQ